MKFSESLKKNRDFQRVYAGGRSNANRHFVMYAMKNGSSINRLGISVSKKVGNSVVRHRIKRYVKECYRLHEDLFEAGYDLIVIARVAAKDIDYREAEGAFLHLCRKCAVMKNI